MKNTTRHCKTNLLFKMDDAASLETFELLSIPNFRKTIKKSVKQVEQGETFSMENVFRES